MEAIMENSEKKEKDEGRRNFLKTAGVVGLGAALGVTGGGKITKVYGKAMRPIKVGMMSILSGPLAGYGEYQKRGCDFQGTY
jgi:hypothetical protein